MAARPSAASHPATGRPGPRPRRLAAAALFGLAFGFLLQKGGVGKYHVLIGQLLLQDFTVVKVMLTAILVGMVGIFTLHRQGLVELAVKPTRLGANIIGGLVFGAGFGLIGYCPGTIAAALGQGSLDSLFAMAGLVAGSYLYAEASRALQGSVEKWGDKGPLTLPQLLRVPRKFFLPAFAATLGLVLFALARLTVR